MNFRGGEFSTGTTGNFHSELTDLYHSEAFRASIIMNFSG